MAIVVNKPLPEFEANATGGVRVSNVSHVGKTMVLYFYPKDNTPGCTTEAMQFRDKYKDFVKAGAQVFGVSRDNMRSQLSGGRGATRHCGAVNRIRRWFAMAPKSPVLAGLQA